MLDDKILMKAFKRLDQLMMEPVHLLIGGGTAMILAHGEMEATADVDAVPVKTKVTLDDLKDLLISVSKEMGLPPDWINPYFGAFTHVLPSDYETRVQTVFNGDHLTCDALGAEDLLVMKLMAGRQKDERHIRRLLKKPKVDLEIVETQLETLKKRNIPGAALALDRLDDVRDAMGLG